MALPRVYLTTVKNLHAILEAMKSAQAPDKFTIKFLESLDFKSTADRLIVNVLKAIGFLSADGSPTERYFRFLDQTQSSLVLDVTCVRPHRSIRKFGSRTHIVDVERRGRRELVGDLRFAKNQRSGHSKNIGRRKDSLAYPQGQRSNKLHYATKSAEHHPTKS
jgi:hypothetical protein